MVFLNWYVIIIGHGLGGTVALSWEKQYEQEGNNPYGIIQSKTFGVLFWSFLSKFIYIFSFCSLFILNWTTNK